MIRNDLTTQKGSVVAWLALIVALGALGLAYLAYQHTSPHPNQSITTDYDQAIAQLNIKMARLQAAAELEAIAARQASKTNYAQFQQDLIPVRNNLKTAYQNAKLETSSEWQGLSQDFDQLGVQIQTKAVEARASLQALIARLVNY